MEGARRVQRLGVACLILAAAIAPPALSSAQEESSPSAATTPPPAASDPVQTPGTGQPAVDSQDGADANKKPGDKPDAPRGSDPTDVVAAAPSPTPVAAVATGKQPKAVAAASALVSIGDNFFSPGTVSVAVGDTVTWKNNGQAQHSATASNGSFDTGLIGPGQSRSHTFSTAGTFSYFCTVHGTAQSGTVRVAAASGGGGGGNDGGADSSGSGQSEATAVASAGAAGDANTLPLTGFASLSLALVGLALLASGIVISRLEDQDRHRFLRFPLR